MSTVFSRDARALVETSRAKNAKISDAVYALMEGPGVLDDIASTKRESSITANDLVYPLPASKAQREIGYHLFVKNEPAILTQGPPGKPLTGCFLAIPMRGQH